MLLFCLRFMFVILLDFMIFIYMKFISFFKQKCPHGNFVINSVNNNYDIKVFCMFFLWDFVREKIQIMNPNLC